jgi:hypothetical protein
MSGMSCRSSFIYVLILITSPSYSQTIGSSLPSQIKKHEKFLFYLHGGVVTVLGNNAINQSAPEWGPYEYLNILDSLRSRGFNVISENRKEGVEDVVYANKIVKQVDSLFKAEVPEKNILLLGASSGWNIVLQVSKQLKNSKMKYIIMGGCWPDTYKDYADFDLRGNFLSIFESSDPHGTCYKIFENRKDISSGKEIKLNTGLSHGFIYKGYKEWIDPAVDWFNKF